MIAVVFAGPLWVSSSLDLWENCEWIVGELFLCRGAGSFFVAPSISGSVCSQIEPCWFHGNVAKQRGWNLSNVLLEYANAIWFSGLCLSTRHSCGVVTSPNLVSKHFRRFWRYHFLPDYKSRSELVRDHSFLKYDIGTTRTCCSAFKKLRVHHDYA